jgi:hypothetical protein
VSKLFKLKEWLTIEEAANHLTSVLGEKVQEKDVFRLALDRHLLLSVNFVNGADARTGEIVGVEGIEWREISTRLSSLFLSKSEQTGEVKKILASQHISDNEFVNFGKKVHSISGVWDLLMFGGERIDIEHYYQALIGGPEVSLINIDGAFVRKGNKVAQLQESFDNNEYQQGSQAYEKWMEQSIIENELSSDQAEELREKFRQERFLYIKNRNENRDEDYYPSGRLPQDSSLVVKTSQIMKFLQTLDSSGTPKDKPLKAKEKNSLLVVIASLCKELGIDYKAKGMTSSIELMTEKIGAPLADDTIRKILKQLEDAVIARSK